MDKNVIDEICKNIYRRFPPVKGKRPKVSKQSENRYLLVFSGSGSTPDGQRIQHTVRVVADEEGRIIKASTSR